MCYIFYKISRKQYAELSVILAFMPLSNCWELKNRSKSWISVPLQVLTLLGIGVAIREHV